MTARPGARSNNPFAQSVWESEGSGSAAGAPATGAATSRATRLAELFRPPYDLMSSLTWDEARDLGKDEKKWILVNLQDMSDFNCQALNRDIWKDEPIKQLVSQNFVFLQFDKVDPASQQYISFYFPHQTHENPNNYPHVSIIDPRTGEQVKVWSGIPFPAALDFYGQLVEFLDRYSLAANSKNPVTKAKRPERAVNVDRMTEEEMLRLAMANSLESNGADASPDLIDPDELTKSVGDLGKGKEKAEPEEAATPATSAPQISPFARIPSDRPHVEPAADPKTTTRIQVRNPPSRIIRRFGLNEPVVRLYEWLKAEPIAGKEGVEFELKSMPQGNDLIEYLDQTIQEAGLANGTVMIEFVEPEE
jgi:UBX domain-containing protein 7